MHSCSEISSLSLARFACILLASAGLTACGGVSSPDEIDAQDGDDITSTAEDALIIKAQPALQTTQPYFPASAPWYTDVSTARVSSLSSTITSWMVSRSGPKGWGTGIMKIDFSIPVVDVPAGTAKRAYSADPDYFYGPDCDTARIPVPQGGAVEQAYGIPTSFGAPFSGYNCADFADGADCHLLFLSRSEHRLYEVYHGTIDSSASFITGCLAVWNTNVTSVNGRGQQCSSADAAGFPIAPLMFSAEEIAAGQINHAIRFVLPNSMIRRLKYVAPATHGANTSGPSTSLPYGARLRLRASYPLSTLSPAAQVVARAMQKYGMLLSDGGNIALTAQSDVLSTVKWASVGLNSSSLSALSATDFEVIAYGIPTTVTFDCTRSQVTD